MWIDRAGNNYTSTQVAARLARIGSSHTAETLTAAYRVGAILHNGGVWFQRVA